MRNPRFSEGNDLVRFQLERDLRPLDEEIMDATLNLAGYFNMLRGETTLTGKYDLIAAPGGARRAPLHRACAAAQSIVEGRVDAKILVIAGSTRLLKDEEKPIVQDYAPDAVTEYDLCFGASLRILEKYPTLPVYTVRTDNPNAGNDDVIDRVMDFYHEEFPESGPISVAMVTTRHYAVGLHLDMARAAKRHGWRNFLAAGHCVDPETLFNRSMMIYFSECLTTLRKAAIAAAEDC